jgi:hypothetical protein
LEHPQMSDVAALTAERRRASGRWMASCYDDWEQTIEHIPNKMIYRDDYKRWPTHPWNY